MAPDVNTAENKPAKVLTSHRINGVVDLPKPDRVSGWAIDRSDPDNSVTVEILKLGSVIAKTDARKFRADLQRSGLGTGNYGYSVELDEPVLPGMEFTISARARTADGESDTLRQIGHTTPADDPDRRLLQEILLKLSDDAEAREEQLHHQRRMLELCERIELTQARIDTKVEKEAPRVERSVPAWLALLVFIAMLCSIAGLAIGLASLGLI